VTGAHVFVRKLNAASVSATQRERGCKRTLARQKIPLLDAEVDGICTRGRYVSRIQIRWIHALCGYRDTGTQELVALLATNDDRVCCR
jgi:hypothetical protein